MLHEVWSVFLTLETQFLENFGVTLSIVFLEVLQVLAAVCHHLK